MVVMSSRLDSSGNLRSRALRFQLLRRGLYVGLVALLSSGCEVFDSSGNLTHDAESKLILFFIYAFCTALPAGLSALKAYGSARAKHEFGEEEQALVYKAVSRTTLLVLLIPVVLLLVDIFNGHPPGGRHPAVMVAVAGVVGLVFGVFFYLIAGVLGGCAAVKGAQAGFGYYNRWACASTAALAALLGPVYLLFQPVFIGLFAGRRAR